MREVSAHCDILVQQVDMLHDYQIEAMVQAAVSQWGRVDYAVNSAGKTSSTHSSMSSALSDFEWWNVDYLNRCHWQ